MKISTQQVTKIVSLPSGEKLTILQDVSINIESGEKLGILGVSGSGKSTLLGILAGLDLPSQGQILWEMPMSMSTSIPTNDDNPTVNNKTITYDLGKLNEDGRASLRLNNAGFVFQNFELLPAYTALENVLLPLELGGAVDARARAKECLELVGLEHRLNHFPNQLSGGEQQRVAIARAFAAKPKILFADEPTGNLDQKTGAQVIQLLFKLNEEQKTTLVCVTHDKALSQICDRTLLMEEGKIKA